MNPLATELNTIIEGSVASDLLSGFGKRFYFPKGIAAQSAEATAKAHRHNATIGMAFVDGGPMMLPSIRRELPGLTPKQAVGYAPNAGDADLRAAWKDAMYAKNPDLGGKETSTPMVVSGLTNGISQLADLFADPGDIVIVPDMFWGNYRLIFEARKEAEIRTFPFCGKDKGFSTSGLSDALDAAAPSGKAIVILNFPNNPTGYSPTGQEVDRIIQTLTQAADAGLRLLVIVDDAYFGLFYEDDTYKQSIFARIADLHDNILAVKVDGPTKEDFVWGFRIGFVTFGGRSMNQAQYEALEKKLLGAIRSSISNSSRPAQSLLLKAMQSGSYDREKLEYFDILKARYALVKEIVASQAENSPLEPLAFNSGYFMSFRLNGANTEDLRLALLNERGIGTISIQETYLRVAYASIEVDAIRELYGEIFSAADRLLQ